jgi:16S rRNA (cytosine967-C5)-methyltransferase
MGTLRDLERPETAREGFDRVLVDAPCSGLGTLRRRPDARWRIQPSDLPKLRAVQGAILARAADALRPGGTLVYSTCTLVSGENEEVVEELLAERPDLQRAVPREKESPLHALLDESGDLRCLPHKHNTDGFYAARLERAP